MERFVARNVVNPFETLPYREIQVRDGAIAAVRPAAGAPEDDERDAGHADGSFAYAVPGFIDLHTHGAAGHDVMDLNETGLAEITRHHLQHGTTGFLGSSLTAPLDTVEQMLSFVRDYMPKNRREAEEGRAASLLGVHLEGPWVSPERAGAQSARYMHEPDEAAARLIRSYADLIRMVTFSYHFASAGKFLDLLVELGIIAACGHDQTIDEQILEGFRRGLRYITHLYSMTSSFQRVGGLKHLGTLEMALITPGVTVEVIADGRHITEHFWRFITHNKSYDDIVIVSDSMRWAGMPAAPDQVVRVGEIEVIIDDGVAWLPDRSAFAGSIGTMDDMFRRLVVEWGVGMNDAVRMTSWNQARLLGLDDRLGSIAPGKRADLLLLDDELKIRRVIKAGRVAAPAQS